MPFFSHLVACFGSVFLDLHLWDNPGKHTVQEKRLDQVIETGKGVKNGEITQTGMPHGQEINIGRR